MAELNSKVGSVLCSELAKGYRCEFAEPVPESLSCPVCLLPLRDPHLVSCCGAKYCEPCLDRANAAEQQCPLCNEEFVSMLDRSIQKKILRLVVYCSMKRNGCQWKGELSLLHEHETDECEYLLVECRYSCGERVPHCMLAEHEREDCPKRSTDAKMESLMKTMEARLSTEINRMKENHKEEIATVRKEFAKILHDERESHRREVTSKEKFYNAEMNELKASVMRFMWKIEVMVCTTTAVCHALTRPCSHRVNLPAKKN